MILPNRGASWARVVLVQLGIVASLLILYKLYLPRMQRNNAARETAAREQRIQSFARSMIVEDTSREGSGVSADGKTLSHPQKLLERDSMAEVQQVLGAPGSEFSDAGGGQHLTWTGTDHRLEAAFSKGVLYSLTYSSIRTGRGAIVFESSQHWQAF